MSTIYDVAIIGSGVAGGFAAKRIVELGKSTKCILFDFGRPPGKRRLQMNGWLGVFPNSDGKLYSEDVNRFASIVGAKTAKKYHREVASLLKKHSSAKIIKDTDLYSSLEKRLEKNNYTFNKNDYVQLYPKEIHSLSKEFANDIADSGNFTYSFDNEVYNIHKQKNGFSITTEMGEFFAKKILISVGRSGWRWAAQIYKNFGIIENNDIASFGIRAELPSFYMKEFNKSSTTLRKDDVEIGPICWNGTVIPEDHVDLAISSFRSNEARWKTDKVSFNIIGYRNLENDGFEQTVRLGKLSFILSNDRIFKEKTSTIVSNKSKLSIIPEYNWLKDAVVDLGKVIPEFLSKSYFHIPTIMPMPPKIKIGSNMETEIDNLFVAGESAGIHGILSAAMSGTLAGEKIAK